MIVAWLAFYDSLLAVALVGAGMAGAHWSYVPPFVGFQVFVLGFLLGIVALLLGIIGIFATRNPIRRHARPRAVVGTVLGLIIAGPIVLMILMRGKYPAINDITTDTQHPPEFAHAGELNANHGRDMKYDVAKYAAKQQEGYGQLDPLKMPEPPDDAFKNVSRVASQMPDWTITNTDPSTRTIEGYSTSDLFHFNDDFVIQVRSGEGGGSLVEMRSKSRDGIGDFGVNYKRIKTFFTTVAPESKTS